MDTVHKYAETIQGRKLYEEIQYLDIFSIRKMDSQNTLDIQVSGYPSIKIPVKSLGKTVRFCKNENSTMNSKQSVFVKMRIQL